MSDNKTTIQNLYGAFATGDMPTVLSILDPQVSWTESAGFPYGGTYIGHDAVLEGVFARLGSEWDNWAAVPAQFVAEGDTVVVLGTYSGTYKATGKSIEVPYVHVFKLGDGVVKTFVQHTDTVLVRQAM